MTAAMTTLPDRLLACPFCGSEAVAENFVVEACVRCLSCKAQVVRQHGTYDDTGLPAAIAAWNRREAATALSVRVPEGDMARALEWVRMCAREFSGTLEEISIANSALASIEEAIAAYTTPQPGDGVVVPREPTREMQHAYMDSIDKHLHRVQTDPPFGRFDNHRLAYKAMIAAAPSAKGVANGR
jgi:hypothetical protein